MTRLVVRTALAAGTADATSRVLLTLLSILFARALGPQQMGLLAAAQLLPGVLSALAALSETAALVRSPTVGAGPAQARAAAILRIALTVSFLILTAAIGLPLLKAVLGDGPDLSRGARLLGILTLGLGVEALGTYPRVLLQWHLRLTPVIAASFGQATTHFGLSLVVLAQGWGLEALCVAVVVAQAAAAGLVWIAWLRWQPDQPSPRARLPWRPLVSQYVRLFTSTALAYVNMRLDNFLVGASLGTASMALYSMSWTASRSLAFVVSQIYSSAVLPVLAASAPDPVRLAQESARAFRLALWATLAAASVLWIIADPLLPLVLGEPWRPAVMPLRIMLFSLLSAPFISGAQAALVAEGHAERVGLATVANTLVLVLAVPPAARTWGLAGAAGIDLLAAMTVASVLTAASPGFQAGLRSLPVRLTLGPAVLALAAALIALRVNAANTWMVVFGRVATLAAIALVGGMFLALPELNAQRSARRRLD